MKKRVVIFGASSLARLAYIYLSEDSPYEIAAFTVSEQYLGEGELLGLDVVPFERIEQTHPPEQFAMFVAVGYKRVNKVRAEIYNSCRGKGYEMISYVNSKAIHWGHIEIGDNCFIREGTIIQPFAKIGNDVIIGGASLIGHDVVVGDHCYIANHAAIVGHVKIGPYCFIGANATIRDGITIAPECVIGAGAIIMKDTEAGGVYRAQKAEKAPFPSSELRSFK